MKRTPTVIALIAAGALIAGCGSSAADPTGNTGQETTATSTEATATGTTATDEVAAPVTSGRFQFNVTNVTPKTGRVPDDGISQPIVPGQGAQFFLVTVDVKNVSDIPAGVFCTAWVEEIALWAGDKGYTKDDRTDDLATSKGQNRMCSDIQPGLTATRVVLFETPVGTVPDRVGFIDAEQARTKEGRERAAVAQPIAGVLVGG